MSGGGSLAFLSADLPHLRTRGFSGSSLLRELRAGRRVRRASALIGRLGSRLLAAYARVVVEPMTALKLAQAGGSLVVSVWSQGDRLLKERQARQGIGLVIVKTLRQTICSGDPSHPSVATAALS